MSLIQVSQPAAVPLSLAEIKAQCRQVLPDEDAILAGYIRAAVDYVQDYTSLRLITQTWAYSVDCWPHRWNGYIALPIGPVQSITSISYLDTNGTPQTLSPGIYSFRGDRVTLAPGATWPSILHGLDVITITFVVGYGDDHNFVPRGD
jgi:uncharacterized phiE125 gp8 family phage protein